MPMELPALIDTIVIHSATCNCNPMGLYSRMEYSACKNTNSMLRSSAYACLHTYALLQHTFPALKQTNHRQVAPRPRPCFESTPRATPVHAG